MRWLYGLTASVLGFYIFRDAALNLRKTVKAGLDFIVDLRLARAFEAGYNPYTREGSARALLDPLWPMGLGHPPSTAFWALPFARLDDHASTFLLAWLSAFLLLMQTIVLARELNWPVPLASAWLVFATLLGSEFFAYHAQLGQLSALIGFCLFLTWLAIRSDSDVLAGLALGCACSMKPFSGVIVVLFLIWKRFKAVGVAIAVYAAISLYMTSRFGWISWPQFFAAQKVIADAWLDSVQNHSLHGIIMRFFRPACGPHGPVIKAATLISSAIGLGLIGGASYCAWRLPPTQRNKQLLLAGYIALAVFTSQWAWEHYYVILLVPFALLATELVSIWTAGRSCIWVALGAALFAFGMYAMFIPIQTKRVLQTAVRAGDHSKHLQLHVYEALNSAPVVALLLVAFCIIGARVRTLGRAQRVGQTLAWTEY